MPSGPLAVVTTYFGGRGIGLSTPDGKIVATAILSGYTAAPSRVAMPWTSTSLTRLYYLDGGSQVRYLKPDGTKGVATSIVLGPNDMAGFAVSPDDSRIAVSIFSYSLEMHGQRTYIGMHMYVQDLQGGGHPVDIFSSTSAAEYPIGWVGSHVIVAVATPWGPAYVPAPNPYDASAYHVVDATNGDRLASLCDNSNGPAGWIQQFGTICFAHDGPPSLVRWDGSSVPVAAAIPNPIQQWLVAESPDGSRAAIAGTPIHVVGRGADDPLPVAAWNIFGWLDGSHIVYQAPASGYLSIVDLQTRVSADLEFGSNTYFGAFPASVT